MKKQTTCCFTGPRGNNIAVYDDRPGGGTGYTVNYAREQNLRITIINPKFF